jgi:ATP-binding cassette subfamily B multidrug efflux pump
MIKTLAKCIGKYKKESIITPIFTAVEVFLEILIPFITASIIDKGIQAGDMRKVGIYGGIMLIIAFLSLFVVYRQESMGRQHQQDLRVI